MAQPSVRPTRPSHGTKGKAITIASNFFQLQGNLSELSVVLHDVDITPDAPRKSFRRKLLVLAEPQINALLSTKFGCVYDGSQLLFTVGAFRQNPTVIHLEVPDKNGQPITDSKRKEKNHFTIKITAAGNVPMDTIAGYLQNRGENPRQALQALDVVLRNQSANLFTQVGSSYYYADDPSSHHLLGRNSDTELWLGHRQSLVLTEKGPMMCIDQGATTMIAPLDVIDFFCLKLRCRPDGIRINPKSAKLVCGIQVETMHSQNKRRYKVIGVSPKSASQISFEYEGKQITVAKYFEVVYKKKLRYPNLPCLLVGSTAKPVDMPMEVCKFVPGQMKRSTLSTMERAEMVIKTCVDPTKRLEWIRNGIPSAAQDKYLAAFGVDVNPKLVMVEGRVLPPPQILVTGKGNKPEPVRISPKGSWQMDQNKLARPVNLERWVVCHFGGINDNQIGSFLEHLSQVATKIGIKIAKPLFVELIDQHRAADSLTAAIQRCPGRPQLVMVLFPDTNSRHYCKVKRVGDSLLGVPSQGVDVMKAINRQKNGSPYLTNLLLKINLKLGGTNSIAGAGGIALAREMPTMVIGADVHHPAPNSEQPSIAALVCSLDKDLRNFHTVVRVQSHQRKEVMEGIGDMITECARRWYDFNKGVAPARIIFYRDGVGDAQFDIVIQDEIAALRAALSTCLMPKVQNYAPRLSFIIVQKRNHLRLFEPSVGNRYQNVGPGTVVDSGITHPREHDFYLCSHFGLKGTSKPTHYHVLTDDNNLGADNLQRFTYDLCYLFGRSMGAVSNPAPCYYAHLAAFKARMYTATFSEDEENWDTVSQTSGASERSSLWNPPHALLQPLLYFM